MGTTIGGYQVVGSIGTGGMGAVYLGEHRLLGRKAAIKVLLPQYCRNHEFVERFFNEARAAAAIKHPGIVEIYDFGHRDDGSAYIVMEFLEGETLASRIARLGRLPIAMVTSIGQQVASVLSAAHGAGIVHRDLKPDNVFLVADPDMPRGERIKLLDFGIAKLGEDHGGSVKTKTGLVMGTPAYMAPEQCKGAGTVTHRADLYSLGCILYEMTAGMPPFQAAGAGEMIAMHIYEPVPDVAARTAAAPPALAALITALLAKSPEQRVSDADTVRSALGSVSMSGPSPLARPEVALRAPRTPAPKTTLTGASAVSVRLAAEPAGGPARIARFLIAAIGAAAIGVALIALVVGSGGDDQPEIAATPADAAAPTEGAESIRPDAAEAPAAAQRRAILVRSTPSGAAIYRGETNLGTTPMSVDIELDGNAFELALVLDGFKRQTLTVSDASEAPFDVALQADREEVSRPLRTSRVPRAERAASSPVVGKPPPPPSIEPPSRDGRLNPFDKPKPAPKPNPFDNTTLKDTP